MKGAVSITEKLSRGEGSLHRTSVTPKTFLVMGATGQQGGAVADQLLQRGHKVRALVRNASSGKAQQLATKGAELVTGTMEDSASVRQTVDGVDSVFLVTTPFEAGMEAEVRQGINVADAAKAAGVPVVFTSVAWAWARTGIPHFESKWEVEQHMKNTGVRHSVIGPVYFMENTYAPWAIDTLRQGTVAIALEPQTRQFMIAIPNIADFAVLALEHPERLEGRRIDIAGDVLTGEEVTRTLAEVTGREMRYFSVPKQVVRENMSDDLAVMFEYYDREQPTVDLDALRSEFPEVRLLTFRQWAEQQDWQRLLG